MHASASPLLKSMHVSASPLPQAVWSLVYATSSRRRAGVLAYWAALMALALPAMQRLAASGRVSNIICKFASQLKFAFP